MKDLKKKKKEIKEKISKEMKNHYMKMFFLLSKLYKLEKSSNRKYTFLQLALDNSLNEIYVTRVMSLRRMNWTTKKLIREELITPICAGRVLSRINESKQDNIFKTIINLNMNSFEIDKFIKNSNIIIREVEKAKHFSNEWNAYKSISNNCIKFKESLLGINNIPNIKREECLKKLEGISTMLESSMKVLKNGSSK